MFYHFTQLGILNVIEALELDPEVVYSIYLAASADRYVWVPLERHKIVSLTSLDAILFINMQILFHHLVIGFSSQEAVVKRGDELLKKKASGVNFDDPLLINRLFVLFSGRIKSCFPLIVELPVVQSFSEFILLYGDRFSQWLRVSTCVMSYAFPMDDLVLQDLHIRGTTNHLINIRKDIIVGVVCLLTSIPVLFREPGSMYNLLWQIVVASPFYLSLFRSS